MRVATTPHYGPAHVIRLGTAPEPSLGERDVLVAVAHVNITAGDRRLRAADFPGVSAVLGRLMMGITAPRHPVQGTMFAGTVVATGAAVTRFDVGDRVMGSADHGANAERIAVPEDGALARVPDGVDLVAAAATPYGAGTALTFLRDLAAVKAGEHVLVLGASGGVGRYAVQIAKHLGAEVTAVCSARAAAMVRQLGADHVIDHRQADFTTNGTLYDVIFDIADASSFVHSAGSLSRDGRYLTLYISGMALLTMAWTALFGRKRSLFSIALGDAQQTAELAELLRTGVISPIIAQRFPFDRMADAHAAAERSPHGEIVVDVQSARTTPARMAAS